MRTTRAISISLPPAELKQAVRLAKQTNRSLSGLFREGLKRLQHEPRAPMPVADEYTPEQRRVIDAELALGLEDFKAGRFYGPFASADEAVASMKENLKKRAAARKMQARGR